MEFNKAYSRQELMAFLRVNLPEDFRQDISCVENPVRFQLYSASDTLGRMRIIGFGGL